MTTPIDPVALGAAAPLAPLAPESAPALREAGLSFARMMLEGAEQTNARLLEADRLTRAFALGEDVPVHQVTFALEQARLSFELMNQVRTRLLESYQEILRMQV